MTRTTAFDPHAYLATHFEASTTVPRRFFEANADALARASFQMARRFAKGGRLLVFGSGRSVTDAQHVSVEFVHPVIVGKRALPAIALTNDIAAVLALVREVGHDEVFSRQIQLLGAREDIALGLSVDGDRCVTRGLEAARELGLLTVAFGAEGLVDTGSDFAFAVPCASPNVVQEVHETAYHVLWETVHVFFDHKGLLEEP